MTEADAECRHPLICIGDQPSLDFGGKRNPDGQGFAAFGRVLHGMDVVRRIQAARSDGQFLTPPVLIRSRSPAALTDVAHHRKLWGWWIPSPCS